MCISWFMVTRDVFKVLKLHSPNFENFQNITCAHNSRNALALIQFPTVMEMLCYPYTCITVIFGQTLWAMMSKETNAFARLSDDTKCTRINREAGQKQLNKIIFVILAPYVLLYFLHSWCNFAKWQKFHQKVRYYGADAGQKLRIYKLWSLYCAKIILHRTW